MPDVPIQEWLNLAVRWIHVIVGIAWIGSSFFFMWLDSHLEPIEEEPEVKGELWMVHGGGFYHAKKYHLVPGGLPERLHWFMWEATWTWITGFALLFIVYYLGKGFLVDPQVLDISQGTATLIGLGALGGGWLVYDLFFRSPLGRMPMAGSVIFFVAMVAFAYGLTLVFSGRGAYIHVGAMMGTMMAANVWVHIIPAQRQLVRSFETGEEPDLQRAVNAKLRSTHNNYLTLPVLFIMISNHFPHTYGHAWNWAVLAGLSVVGAVVRHWFNLKNAGRKNLWLLPAAALGMIALALVSAPRDAEPAHVGPVGFAEVQTILTNRCVTCHAENPTDDTWKEAPGGLMLDKNEHIATNVDKIELFAVKSHAMPLGNKTGMTQEERDKLGAWIRQGAKIE